MITEVTNDREPSFEPKKARELGEDPGCSRLSVDYRTSKVGQRCLELIKGDLGSHGKFFTIQSTRKSCQVLTVFCDSAWCQGTPRSAILAPRAVVLKLECASELL